MASGNFILGISAQITNLNDVKKQLDSSFKLHKQIEIPVKIKDGEYGIKQITTLRNNIGQTITEVKKFDSSGKQLGDSITRLSTNFNKTSQSTALFGNNLSKLLQTGAKVAVFSVLASGINAVKNAMASTLDIVKEYDDALTDFKKVSDLRGESLSEYAKQLGELGTEVARSRTEMIASSTEFKKSGFSDADSAQLAKVANLYMNVADAEISAGQASSYVVSQMKAFDISAENAIEIIDKTNEV